METVQINLEELREKHGEEIAKELEENIEWCSQQGTSFKIDVNTSDSERFTTIIFATRAYAQIYEVSNRRKKIAEKNFIGSFDCEKTLELMKSF